MAYETEEQQVEAIKRFWNENGTSIIVGAVVGLGGLWGWRYFQDQQIQAKETHSAEYQQAVEAIGSDEAKVISFANKDKSLPYAQLAALQLAKTFVEQEQLDKALEQLKLVVDNGDVNTLKPIAVTRSARILAAQEKYAEALAMIETSLPESYKAQVAELKGDILLKQGNPEQARIAYQAAADADGLTTSTALQMKIDDLAVAKDGV